MNARTFVLELIELDLSRFDELDVARCVAALGGSMRGRLAIFSDSVQLAAALDVLAERFGTRFFKRREEPSIYFRPAQEMSHA